MVVVLFGLQILSFITIIPDYILTQFPVAVNIDFKVYDGKRFFKEAAVNSLFEKDVEVSVVF
jgi:hypothetical protein